MAESKGLGDTVAKVTTVLGIPPCPGCTKRQKWLNRVFPYRSPNMVKTAVPLIPAKIVTQVADVLAGCVFIPTPQPIVLGCPVCGVKLEVLQRPVMKTTTITIPGVLTFSCGWKGMLVRGEWVKWNAD